jgi:hypothetical protein
MKSHSGVGVDMPSHARRMASLSGLIFSGEIILFKHNSDSAFQKVHHLMPET